MNKNIMNKLMGVLAIALVLLMTIMLLTAQGDANVCLNEVCIGNPIPPFETATEEPTEILSESPIESSPAFIISPEERELIARLIYLEARGENYECQKGIVSVVINRWMSGYWGNTIGSVIYAKNQFTPAKRIPYTTPNETNYDAVDDVLQNGTTLPYYVLYFRANYHHKWQGYVGYKVIDNTYFGYKKKDVK